MKEATALENGFLIVVAAALLLLEPPLSLWAIAGHGLFQRDALNERWMLDLRFDF